MDAPGFAALVMYDFLSRGKDTKQSTTGKARASGDKKIEKCEEGREKRPSQENERGLGQSAQNTEKGDKYICGQMWGDKSTEDRIKGQTGLREKDKKLRARGTL